jgi:hypothetical protein
MDLLRSRSQPCAHQSIGARRRLTLLSVLVVLFAAIDTPLIPAQRTENTQSAASQPEVAKLSADQVASIYYPQEMADPDGQAGQNYCAVSSEKSASGAPTTVFAAYIWGPDTNPGEIWVFQRQSNGDYRGSRVGDPNLMLSADRCDISVTDAGPAVGKVIEVTLWGNRNSSSFLFRWDGSRLATIGPVDRSADSRLIDAVVESWRLLPIFSGNAPGLEVHGGDPYDAIYRFDGRRYAFQARVAYSGVFRCLADACDATYETFRITRKMTGPFVLRVGNGELSGKGRVPAASVEINGVDMGELAPADGVTVFPAAKLAVGVNKIHIRPQPSTDGSVRTIYVLVEDHTK